MPPDPRFVRLEEKLTFVEHQLGELDGVVRDLGDSLHQLGRRLDHLAGTVERHAATLADPTAAGHHDHARSDDELRDERPPHW